MTAVDTIYQYVLDETKRPDLQAEIYRRIQREVIYFHRKDMWKRDLIEQIYTFGADASCVTTPKGGDSLFLTSIPASQQYGNIQKIDLCCFPRLRFLQYVRKWQPQMHDPDTGTLGTFYGGDLTERAPDRMFDGYGGDVSNVMYRAGNWLNLKSSTPLSKVAIGWFPDPLVEPIDQLCSWIADLYPSLIACRIKKTIFANTGKLEEAKAAKFMEDEELLSLYSNNVRIAMA